MVKRLPAMHPFLGREDPWRRKWPSTPALLPGKSHGLEPIRLLRPWGRKESDRLSDFTSLSLSILLRMNQKHGSNDYLLWWWWCPTHWDSMDCSLPAPLSMEFSKQEYWTGLPFRTPGDLPHPGIETATPMSPALAGRFFPTEPPGKPC